MRPIIHLLLLVPALIGVAAADLPRKAPLTKYSGLWLNSPFTSKPPPPDVVDAPSKLDDYALAGVSPIPGGYQVTLLNRKDSKQRITLETNKPREGFKILSVEHKPGDPLGTVVRMASGNDTGTVGFDESLLALEAPPAPKPVRPQLPPGLQVPGQTGTPQPGQAAIRQPRPRVVPPPNPQGQQVPGAQPVPQQVQPGQITPQQRPAFQPGGRPSLQTDRPSRRTR